MTSKPPMEAEEEEKPVWFGDSGKDGANEYVNFLSSSEWQNPWWELQGKEKKRKDHNSGFC